MKIEIKTKDASIIKLAKKIYNKKAERYGFTYCVPGGTVSKEYLDEGEGVFFMDYQSKNLQIKKYTANKIGGHDISLSIDELEDEITIEYEGKLFGFQQGDCSCRYADTLWKYLFRLISKKNIDFELKFSSFFTKKETCISRNWWGRYSWTEDFAYLRMFLVQHLLQYRKNKKIKPNYGSYFTAHNPMDNILYNFLYTLYKKRVKAEWEETV